MMDKAIEKPDAGLRSLDHYKNRLPPWRYRLRQKILPYVRWETQYVARLQETLRTPALDTYFAMTANLGTHTFFMVILPILFWCGYTRLARAMVHLLASGVFFSGFFKDMLCLPRPLSPPLQRITMSGSAALEYGFPSTHSTNALSVAVYTLFVLNWDKPEISPTTNTTLQIIAYCYSVSIVLGRVYCGMHGFLDVICGSFLGAVLSVVECLFGDAFNNIIHSGSAGRELLIVILIICILVRIHPEPVDDCPCFDDSVAFAGVVIGVEFANWHFAKTSHAWSEPYPSTVPFDLQKMGWLIAVLRIVFGVVLVFVWRATMKPALLWILPPIFRIIEALGLSLPRRYFKQASEYKRVPKQRHDDNVIPSASDIPTMLSSFRRRRAVSIGPQSAADAYETMAYRDKKRRDSLTSPASPVADKSGFPDYSLDENGPNGPVDKDGRPAWINFAGIPAKDESLPAATSPLTADFDQIPLEAANFEDKDLFTNLEKPRVRYDVEVVTKLIVYSGIAWIAAEGAPILFQIVGLSI